MMDLSGSLVNIKGASLQGIKTLFQYSMGIVIGYNDHFLD